MTFIISPWRLAARLRENHCSREQSDHSVPLGSQFARAREARPLRPSWTAIAADAGADEGGTDLTDSRSPERAFGRVECRLEMRSEN